MFDNAYDSPCRKTGQKETTEKREALARRSHCDAVVVSGRRRRRRTSVLQRVSQCADVYRPYSLLYIRSK